ncbi:hypothetical protein SmJEL517_g02435 [Synchytrium microbalum]|uniref:BLOC-1-related complex subunit 6 C-terminal helix domain-containing protein n=1 Tax=Synchytrium microbalum TaxID=1806994 RepID=A0A507C6J3_9FUNG|nr:uncharacterized protein SmJEL517_g02435 [Synchytrium microbalum]TPX35121.1 hypothetical protein SmJEL517_g02435 [Synchytrium microbalum]
MESKLNAQKKVFSLPSVVQPSGTGQSASFSVPLDPQLLDDIEREAHNIAADYADMIQRLQNRIINACIFISLLIQWTRESVSVNKLAVNNLCDTVDTGVKRATELINRTEELDFATIKGFNEQVKSMKLMLDAMEASLVGPDK